MGPRGGVKTERYFYPSCLSLVSPPMPTPVSALIHAATLVTAGVYLMLRVSPLLEYASTTLMAMSMVGGLTAVFAATSGLVQTDIKRVIAYSTCSQVRVHGDEPRSRPVQPVAVPPR